MDKLGSDVMKKMKSAIKAKLLEVGMDVDDELPDYIIVMVANKRTQAQMENDLSLFLGNHTRPFTEWLHQVIKRLESVEVGSRQKVVEVARGQNQQESSQRKTSDQVPYTEASPGRAQEEYVPMPVSVLRPPVVAQDEIAEEADDDVLNMDVEDSAANDETLPVQVETTRAVVTAPVRKFQDKIQERQKRRTIATEEEVRRDERNSKRARRDTAPASLERQRLVSTIVRPIVCQARNSSKSEDEREEPRKGLGGVCSVVQVTARPHRPAEAQANKKLILRAVAEAQRSVAGAVRLPELKVEKPEPVKELFTRKYLERNQGVVPEKIAVTFPNVQEQSHDKEEGAELEEEEEEEDEQSKDVVMAETEETSVNPQFIVTLDGVRPDTLGDEEDMDEYDSRETQRTVIPVRQRIVAFGAKEPRTTLRRRHSTGSDAPSKQTLEKCKFWPSCRLGDQCVYYHPKAPCKLLPNCTFGENCLFLHPACKFGTSCTKKNCPYSHGKSATLGNVKQPSAAVNGNVACKYFPACTNPQCPFLHPTPCKFGSLCTRPGCGFYHPSGTLPDKNKLKWFAP